MSEKQGDEVTVSLQKHEVFVLLKSVDDVLVGEHLLQQWIGQVHLRVISSTGHPLDLIGKGNFLLAAHRLTRKHGSSNRVDH